VLGTISAKSKVKTRVRSFLKIDPGTELKQRIAKGIGGTMVEKRQINGTNVIKDLRSGMIDRELQMKYRLSTNGLCRIYEKLVERGAMSHSELSEWSPLYSLTSHYKESRSYPRADLATKVSIYDLGTGSIGIMRDISETGLRVAGIDATVGQAMTFQIPVDTFIQAEPLLIVAECKWVEIKGRQKKYPVAGFEILDLPERDSQILRNFLKFLLFSESGEWQTIE
jgi:PilZ domain